MDNSLRGAVFNKFPSITSFANEMNWDRKKASRIVNRVQEPFVADIEQMIPCLGIQDAETFVKVFFPTISAMLVSQQANG